MATIKLTSSAKNQYNNHKKREKIIQTFSRVHYILASNECMYKYIGIILYITRVSTFAVIAFTVTVIYIHFSQKYGIYVSICRSG